MGSSVKNRIMRWTRKNMPTREGLASNRWLAPIAHRFLSPELWRFTRRSVPRGVALGLFAGFIVPLGQIFLAAFLALPTRANVPVAALVTFVTNPFTFPFWALAANWLGSFILKIDVATGHSAVREIEGGRLDWLRELFQLAGVTVFGFMVLALVSAAVGYLVSSWGWRWWIGRKRFRMIRRRREVAAMGSES